MANPLKVLFSSSEALPFVKTGGLADVAGSLPNALSKQGADVALILPAYRVVLEKFKKTKLLSTFTVSGFRKKYEVKLLEAPIKNSKVKAWLVDIPELFDRPDGIYLANDGKDWWDNGERFSIFSKAVVEAAMDRIKLKWKADVVHNNDWQTGLVSALLTLEQKRPRTVFTIHNMAYQGNFPYGVFSGLELPHHWWHEDGVEFYGNMSMLKVGIMYSDKVTTVSPTYAKEICTDEFAYGFEGIMNKCLAEGRLTGVLNGIDQDYWNPEKDDLIPYNYSITSKLKANKEKNKLALLQEMNATDNMLDPEIPLFGLIGRLVEQKGIDLVLSVLPDLLEHSNANFIFLGSGDSHFEHSLKSFTQQYPDRILTYIGYSEALAHKIEAGVDLFLMPSRFEPCGLNQMYSLAYGTLPIVHHTGGLADTVINSTTENIEAGQATGFVFYDPTSYALKETMYYAISLFNQKTIWEQIQKTAMSQNNSWENSAQAYFDLYTVKD
jgi:starch synthase